MEITNPRCITNYAITEVRLYARRPCHSSNGARSLKRLIEKSEAKAAYFPSRPTIPTPTLAAWIIATSFPPSPIPKVILRVNVRIASVTCAFYVGEQRQQTTAGARQATCINSLRH